MAGVEVRNFDDPDEWVLGDEPFIGVEFDATSAATFARS